MKYNPILFILVLLVSLHKTEAMDPLAGQPAPSMRMGIGSRAEAMGNASVASLDPSTVIAYWNPAMAVMLQEPRAFSTGYRFLTLGRRQGFISFTSRIPPRLGLSIALLYHGDHDIPIFDSDGNHLYDGGFMSLATHISLAYRVKKRLSIGLNTTIFSSTLNAGTGDGNKPDSWELGNIDISAFYKVRQNLSLGLNIKGIRATSKWEVPTYGIEMNTVIDEHTPMDVKMGAAWNNTIKNRNYSITYDADLYLIAVNDEALSAYQRLKNGEQVVEHHLGAELFLYPEFPVRMGVSSNEGFSCGAGFYFLNGKLKNGKVDYVFSIEPNGSGVQNGVSWTSSW